MQISLRVSAFFFLFYRLSNMICNWTGYEVCVEFHYLFAL